MIVFQPEKHLNVNFTRQPGLIKKEILKTGQCKMQTADYCCHHGNERVTTKVSLFQVSENNCPQSASAPLPRLSFPL